MEEEFCKYDKVIYEGELFEVLATANSNGMMKLSPLSDSRYDFVWVDEGYVVSLGRAVKMGLVKDKELMEWGCFA